ncbi:uncharacterized protein LOC134258700 [Saccostrea cucullata]|uniref:uncharacterized protein LOC134258700 n=1 Tax=Saccostrea cuccullata TaxID=36930 RepID=UPI002ED040CA
MDFRCDRIDDEVFQSVIRRIPRNIRRNILVAKALADIRDDLHHTLRGCADNVTVEVHMDDYLYEPITLCCGSGSNKLIIYIDEWGNVQYQWAKKTWSLHFNNAFQTVDRIARKIVSGFTSFFGSLFASNNRLEGTSRGYLTY